MSAISDTLQSIVEQLLVGLTPRRRFPTGPQNHRKTLSFEVIRADDLLVVRIDAYNLRLDPGTRQLVPDGPGDSFVVAHFPGQNIAEQAFFEGASPAVADLPPPPVATCLANESRLVFRVPPARLPLDFTVEAILDALAGAETLVSDRTGAPPATPEVSGTAWFGGSTSQFTAIELPWRLLLSPHPDARWAHAALPVAAPGSGIELWHTRLGVAGTASVVDEVSAARRVVRAVATRDLRDGAGEINDPFLMSLRQRDRRDIVRLSSERTLAGNAPVAVRQLMLSALGASADLHGAWNSPEIALANWLHRSTIGRDQYSRVVSRGFLFPFGHRAVKVTITERKLGIATQKPQGPTAYLRQREFIIVREPVKLFSHRAFPFRSLELRTVVTPNLEPPGQSHVQPGGTDNVAFWPRTASDGQIRDVAFSVTATDWEGRVSSFDVPLIFVSDVSQPQPAIPDLVAAYNGAGAAAIPEAPRRTAPLGGQRVAYAIPRVIGDSALDTDALVFAALNATGRPAFLPALRGAVVAVPAIRELTGDASARTIRYEQSYLDAAPNAFGNPGEVFARIEAGAAGLKYSAEKVGGLVAPNMMPQGLSRSFGPVADVAQVVSGSFNPAAIFENVKILGGVPLGAILKKVPFGSPGEAGATVPRLTSTRRDAIVDGVAQEVVETRYLWSVDNRYFASQDIFVPDPDKATFTLDSRVVTPLGGGSPSFDVTGTIAAFKIVLPPAAPLIAANFDSIVFTAGSGRKVDVAVNFAGIEFDGPLKFVNELRRYIPSDGFSDPPYLDITSEGISAGYTLGIPTIGVGIFVLQGISLSAGFTLPFIGGAAGLRFAFCERDHPFLLTVMAFGGGGFFAIDLDTSQITNVEVSLEFGAAVAINLGVAKGSASITGGFYFQKSGGGEHFVAFFRAAGSLRVLGIITVSVELYIGFGYESDKTKPHGGRLFGTASVKVKIKIAFFSKTVKVSIERELGGSDPNFLTMVTPADWLEYCGAFAPEAP